MVNSLTGEFVLKCGYLCLVHVNCFDIFLFHFWLCNDKVNVHSKEYNLVLDLRSRFKLCVHLHGIQNLFVWVSWNFVHSSLKGTLMKNANFNIHEKKMQTLMEIHESWIIWHLDSMPRNGQYWKWNNKKFAIIVSKFVASACGGGVVGGGEEPGGRENWEFSLDVARFCSNYINIWFEMEHLWLVSCKNLMCWHCINVLLKTCTIVGVYSTLALNVN